MRSIPGFDNYIELHSCHVNIDFVSLNAGFNSKNTYKAFSEKILLQEFHDMKYVNPFNSMKYCFNCSMMFHVGFMKSEISSCDDSVVCLCGITVCLWYVFNQSSSSY